MTVSIMGKTLSLKCVLDPMEPWDLEMSPFRTAKKDYDSAIEFLSKSPKAQEIIKKIVEWNRRKTSPAQAGERRLQR